MTPEEMSRATKPAVVRLGAAFGDDDSFAARAEMLGLGTSRWPFYFGGRAGVLGKVPAEVVSAACGFFAPGLVADAWAEVILSDRLDEIVQADVDLCVGWARQRLAGVAGLARAADLTDRVVAEADASGRVLFAAWRALSNPGDDPATRLALNLLRLREHRGSSHLISVTAEGLTPLQAILAGPGAGKAAANGWSKPYQESPTDAAARLAAAERRTDILAGQAYAVLTVAERIELAEVLDQAYQRWQRAQRS